LISQFISLSISQHSSRCPSIPRCPKLVCAPCATSFLLDTPQGKKLFRLKTKSRLITTTIYPPSTRPFPTTRVEKHDSSISFTSMAPSTLGFINTTPLPVAINDQIHSNVSSFEGTTVDTPTNEPLFDEEKCNDDNYLKALMENISLDSESDSKRAISSALNDESASILCTSSQISFRLIADKFCQVR
ncbi:hypothetical protein PENTCL1PPCAC_17989, partial [Pristionchus entomophagus]